MGQRELWGIGAPAAANPKILVKAGTSHDAATAGLGGCAESICSSLFKAFVEFLPVSGASMAVFDRKNSRPPLEFSCSSLQGFAPPPLPLDLPDIFASHVDSEAVFIPSDADFPYYRLKMMVTLDESALGFLSLYFTGDPRELKEIAPLLPTLTTLFRCAMQTIMEVERARTQYDEMAIQTEKLTALGRMAAGIAHEINNPLTGILLFSSSMANKLSPKDPKRESLDVIIEETIRCRGILKDLLEFSRGPKLRIEMGDPNAVISRAVSLTENQFRLKRLSLDISLDVSIPEIPIDAAQIEQLLLNLLINAAEATPAGGKVQVKSSLDDAKGLVRIEVSDTGCGIPAKDADKIFEPFFSTKEKGTGLGLSVSYGIVKNHRGRLRYSRPSGWSSRFTAEFPVGDSSAARQRIENGSNQDSRC